MDVPDNAAKTKVERVAIPETKLGDQAETSVFFKWMLHLKQGSSREVV